MPAAPGPSTGSRRRKEQRYRSVISDIFDGSILSLVQCLTCDRVSALRWEGARLQQPQWSPLGQGLGSRPSASHLPAGGWDSVQTRLGLSRAGF